MAEEELWSGCNQVDRQVHKIKQGWRKRNKGWKRVFFSIDSQWEGSEKEMVLGVPSHL